MNVLYSGEFRGNTTPSIFLAGPSPRSKEVKSWRPEAIEYLRETELEEDGAVFVPEYRTGPKGIDSFDLNAQINWEHFCLDLATVIVMWVPRDLETMPAFTTNIEFGMYMNNGKMLYGRPDGSPKNEYMDRCWRNHGFEPFNNLQELLDEAVDFACTMVSNLRFT